LFFDDVVLPIPALVGTALASASASAIVSPLNLLKTVASDPLSVSPESVKVFPTQLLPRSLEQAVEVLVEANREAVKSDSQAVTPSKVDPSTKT
jgi:hypothetical protein